MQIEMMFVSVSIHHFLVGFIGWHSQTVGWFGIHYSDKFVNCMVVTFMLDNVNH